MTIVVDVIRVKEGSDEIQVECDLEEAIRCMASDCGVEVKIRSY